jgi:hypothetical protein
MSGIFEKNEELSKCFESMKDMSHDERDMISNNIIAKIYDIDPTLLTSGNVTDLPSEGSVKEWYENDPNVWLVISALKKASDQLLKEVIGCFKK